jgi:hypothetical protein
VQGVVVPGEEFELFGGEFHVSDRY